MNDTDAATPPGPPPSPPPGPPLGPAALVTRGAARLLGDLGYTTITEFELANGRRADIMALGRGGDFVIVEVKSGLPDFRADTKWTEYREYSDQFFFAVDERFDRQMLPDDVGVMVADGYGGAILTPAPEHKLAGGRRKALTLRYARAAAARLGRLSETSST